MKVTPVSCRSEVGGIVVLPGPGNLEGWPVSERNDHSAVNSDVWFGDNIHGLTQRSHDSSMKMYICPRLLCTRCSLTDSYPVTIRRSTACAHGRP